MTWIAQTLWDLIAPRRSRSAAKPAAPSAVVPSRVESPQAPSPPAPARVSMRDRYDALVVEMKTTHGVRVRKWRTSSSGCAWQVTYRDGTTTRLIEAPRPRGPMSCAIFLHEIGHHAIGFGRYRPRCLEEYHAWRWALEAMRERGLNVTAAVEKRMAESLEYAVDKALRRGLRRVPAELAPYCPTPRRRRGGSSRSSAPPGSPDGPITSGDEAAGLFGPVGERASRP